MNITGGIFAEWQDLTNTLRSLEEAGFSDYSVYGPEELFTETETSADQSERLDSPQHTAAGTISGVTVNPASGDEATRGAKPLDEAFSDLGFGPSDVARLVAGLQQNQTALLVSAPADRVGQARQLLQRGGARLVIG